MGLARKKLILAKIETVVGTDSLPVSSTNALEVGNPKISPVKSEKVTRNILRSYLGRQEELIATTYVEIEFDVEVKGSGTAGTPDQVSPLLRVCGCNETIVAATSIGYLPVSESFETLTIFDYEDGILYKSVAAKATVSLMFEIDKIAYWKFKITALRKSVTDQAIAAGAVYTQIKPQLVNTTNTDFSIFGLTDTDLKLKTISFDLANDVKFANWVGETGINLSNRNPSGSFEIAQPALSVFNPIVLAGDGGTAATPGTISAQHGTNAGVITTISTATNGATLSSVETGEFNDENTWICGFNINPVAGNDELSILMT